MEPESGCTDPAGQLRQPADRVPGWYVPAAHAEHATAPPAEYCPDRHSRQLPAYWYVPESHDEHPLAPLLGWISPSGHARQLPDDVAPVVARYVCGPHREQLEDPLLPWYWPAEHATHAAAPLDDWKVPSVHPAQAVDPVAGVNWPAGQLEHVLDEEAPIDSDCLPAAQLAQVLSPLLAW